MHLLMWNYLQSFILRVYESHNLNFWNFQNKFLASNFAVKRYFLVITSLIYLDCSRHNNTYTHTHIRMYNMPTKIPCHPLNFGTVAAIFINVVSRYGKLDMRSEWDHSQRHLVEYCRVIFRISKTVRGRAKKWTTKL